MGGTLISGVAAGLLPVALPSPDQAVWYLGPLPLRAYSILILIGIALAIWILEKRYTARGGPKDTALDTAIWMVLFGIVGARVYHVLTLPDAYFGPDGDPLRVFQIWTGGLGIMGGVAFGALGAWIALRRRGLRLAPFADALAPGLLVAQGVGRWGNWFNQELFGRPTDLPWGLEIDAAHLPAGYAPGTLFHPTYLYESLWNLLGAAVLVILDRRFHFTHGRLFAFYLLWYGVGRSFVESLRIDTAEYVLGLRINLFFALVLVAVALIAVALTTAAARRARAADPGARERIYLPGHGPAGDGAAGGEPGSDDAANVEPGSDGGTGEGPGASTGEGRPPPRA